MDRGSAGIGDDTARRGRFGRRQRGAHESKRPVRAFVGVGAIVVVFSINGPIQATIGDAGPRPAVGTATNGRLVFVGEGQCLPHEDCYSSTTLTIDIWSMQSDGTGLTNLTISPGVDGEPVWSPDGERVLFTSNRGGNFDIHVMGADGSGVKALTSDPGMDAYAAWSPSGHRIAYASDGRRTNDLVVMRADGSHKRRIASFGPRQILYGIAWAPNGRRIAFTRTMPDDARYIFVVRPDGSGLRKVTRGTKLQSQDPSWSPDSRRIVFDGGFCVLYACKDWSIFTVNLNGSGLERLTRDAWVTTPDWSPDGTLIAYTGPGEDDAGDIWLMNSDGSDQRPVLVKPDTYDYEPDWQPVP